MEVSVKFHASAVSTPGKEPPASIGQENEWASEPFWKRRKKKILCSCQKSNPGLLARCLVTIVTELPRLTRRGWRRDNSCLYRK